MPGRVVRRSTYLDEYDSLTSKEGVPFVPTAVWKDLVFSGGVVAAVAICAVVLGPYGPSGPPDPTIIQTVPKPDFFFLWLYAVLSYLPPSLETPFVLIAPVMGIAILVALPFVSGEGEKSWHRRPAAILILVMLVASGAVLTRLGMHTPWSPVMNAWSGGPPVPARYTHTASPLQRQGANVFQAKQCRNCHSIGGYGGQRGPTLDAVATRLTEDQLIRQVLQGGGDMPAYGKNLSPPEVTALVSFLETLHPSSEPAAQDASQTQAAGSSGGPNP